MNVQVIEYIQGPWRAVALLIITLVPFFRIALNSYNMRPIEKLRLTVSERFNVYFAQWLILSALTGTALFMLVFGGVSGMKEEGNDPLSGVSWELLAGQSYALAGIFVFLLLFIVYGFFFMVSVKTSFHIVDEEPLEIVKKVNKHIFLLQAKDGQYLFYSEERLHHVKFYEELCDPPKNMSLLTRLYGWKIRWFVTTVVLLVAGAVFGFFNWISVAGWLIAIAVLGLLVLGAVVKNYEDIQRLSSDELESNC